MYLIIMGVTQIRLTDEALNGAFVQDFIFTHDLNATRIYGQTVPGFPLYSWCTALVSAFRMPNAFLLRLPSFLALVALALFSALFARRYHSNFAGAITASVLLTSIVSFKIGRLAHIETIASLLLSCAWFSLYHFGQIRRKWLLSWSLSLALVFLATFGIGAKAIIIFYFPLLFTGRKVDFQRQIQSPQHIGAAAILVLLLLTRRFVAPTLPFFPWNALTITTGTESISGYMGHLCSMFPKTAYYLFPWVLFAWAPFCLAMRQFELDNKMCHFMRCIVTSNAILFWLLPKGSPLHLIPVFGPMAVLIGVHSEVVIRRYQDFFGRLMKWAAWFTLAFSAGAIIFWLCVLLPFDIIVFEPVPGETFPAWLPPVCILLNLIAGIAMLILVSYAWPKTSFRSCLLWCIFAIRIAYLGTWELPHDQWHNSARKVHGHQLATVRYRTVSDTRKADGVQQIHLYLPSNLDIPKVLVETFYLESRCFLVKDASSDIPADHPVYLLTPFSPALSSQEWSGLSQAANLNAKRHIRCTTILIPIAETMAATANRRIGTHFTVSDPNLRFRDLHLPLARFKMSESEKIPNAAFSATRIYKGIPKPTTDNGNKPE